ncbi:MAG: HdeD family acid-resistance protein [Gammaproteobacteria bacterium]
MGTLNDSIKANSRLATIWGGAVVILGFFALMAPWVSGITTTMLIAILMVSAGLAKSIYAFKAETFWQGLGKFLFGGISILFGVFIFFIPQVGLLSIAMILAIYFAADGVLEIIAGFKIRPDSGWGLLLFNGIVSLLLGVLILADWPVSGMYAVGILVGVRLIFAGWSIIALGMTAEAIADET